MELGCQLLKICQIETRRWFLVLAVVTFTYLLFQSLLIPYGNALRSLVPGRDVPVYDLSEMPRSEPPSKSIVARDALVVQALSLSHGSIGGAVAKDVDPKDGRGDDGGDTENGLAMEEESRDGVYDREVDRDVNDDEDNAVLEDVNDKNETSISNGVKVEERHEVPIDQNVTLGLPVSTDNVGEEGALLAEVKSGPEKTAYGSPSVESKMVVSTTIIMYSKSNRSSSAASESDSATSKDDAGIMGNPSRKKIRSGMLPKSITLIDEMDRILTKHRRSSHAMRPRWSSARDREILAARSQIENAPFVVTDRELYAPLFRNVSKFKRSYELMERILKVYIYKEGKRPIFHVPILKGLYASEGWFMKLLRESKRFVVKDPQNAHLFYMPFSSRMLEYALYVRNSHNRTNLRVYLKAYSDKIAAKYAFWNRTGGADHFLVACHDWAPYETRHHMEHCIKALCNADVTVGFKLGRDVSLPETYVRSARNPLKDLGGKPPSQRLILAFYAGNIHGYLRPILLKYWKDKDPDMKIYGPMPPGVASKMNYIQHMKSSKYCICPKGYEVNSPRVVEAIFYECVPVIISDNFVPPFFEVFNWGAFSVVLAEKDIPNLKEILLSIPEKKYLEMQLGVRKVQRHFLWHAKPRKYDLFHMILHSIWYNRIYQIKPR